MRLRKSRRLRKIEGPQGRRITIGGRQLLNFCSNNYLGLADDARLKKAMIHCIERDGVGSGASRLVCGNMSMHEALEEKLAEFKGSEAALVFNSGYTANIGIISSLFGRGDVIFSDKLNHASIIDGILLSGAEFKRYAHSDIDSLEDFLKKAHSFKQRAIITESVFSMDGDVAPLKGIVRLAQKYDCSIVVDEAHAVGVFGKRGCGLIEDFGLENKVDVQMGTLSKAVGSFGAYVCGKKALIDFLINKARSFIYTTALPPAICAASLEALKIIEGEPQRREQLWQNTKYLKSGLQRLGLDTMR
jgi:8-amino-7-oxononanoate synthase